MRQQALIDRQLAGAADILDGAADAELIQRLAIFLKCDLGLVAEAHQRFFAAELRAAFATTREISSGIIVHAPGIAGVLAKGAVGASIAA